MKKIQYSIWMAIAAVAVFSMTAPAHAAAPQTKRVCHDVMVKGKKVQQCKNVKVHQKFKGTAIPPKPAKK